jgi:hypothetical protein
MHFCDKKNLPDKTNKSCDQLWKMRTTFNKLNDSYAKYYRQTEYLAVDEITVLFKIYKLCDPKGYVYKCDCAFRQR